ncbi:hypothetical protein V500_08377 [Pseudogymnoascus sp. VKM F-4518 (FW-2643)]|nr:hypothetical protein V500_08377 [Pseudogymnoascus sp. VKM F-4518 (FW-2643)]
MPPALNPKASASAPYSNRAASITLEQYEKFPLYEYDAGAPFAPSTMPTKKVRLDDNTVGRMYLLHALNVVSKTAIRGFDAFISDGTINHIFLGHGAPCLDSEGQVMLYRPKNTAFGLVPLIGEASAAPIRQGKYIVNDFANLKEMPMFYEYIVAIIHGRKWKYLKPAELGEAVVYKTAAKRTAAQETDEDHQIDSITVQQPGAKICKTDGTDHSQLYLEIEKLSNKIDKNQQQDEMLNSAQKQTIIVLEQNDAFRKQNDALMKQGDASHKQIDALMMQNEEFQKRNDASADALLKQNAVFLELANPRSDNSNQTRLTRRRQTDGMAGKH